MVNILNQTVMEIKKISGIKLFFRSSKPSLSPAMMLRLATLVSVLLLFSGVCANAQEKDAPYVPTPDRVVDEMLDMAHVGSGDYVIDLGCGDGRIVIAAAKRGATALGVDIDGKLIRKARKKARRAGVSDNVMFLKQDLFKTDISGASVITMYLLPPMIQKLRTEFTEQLDPGTRIVSHDFDMGDWEPDRHTEVNMNNFIPDTLILTRPEESSSFGMMLNKPVFNKPLQLFSHNVFYWEVPAAARGEWQWKTGGKAFAMTIDQSFQKIHAEIRAGDTALTIENKNLTGERITIRAANPETETRYLFNGAIDGDTIKGKVQIRNNEGSSVKNWTARRK